MPQGLDLTWQMIRATFWLVKTQNTTYSVLTGLYPQHVGGLPVDMCWRKLGTACGMTVENEARLVLTELIRRGRAGSRLWKGFPQFFPSSGRFAPRPGSWPTPVCPRRMRSGAS